MANRDIFSWYDAQILLLPANGLGAPFLFPADLESPGDGGAAANPSDRPSA